MNSGNDFSQMLPVGTVLDGRYRIERYLASGGFGNTYEATDIRFNCHVAVKEFFMAGTNHRSSDHTTVAVSNSLNSKGFYAQLDKFRREAHRIFNMHNDHIVHVSDLFDENGTSYYVMDLIDGESLKERVKRGRMSEEEVRDVARQLLKALDAVHKAGFYHLDIKPGNIMRDKNGHCTLIDFGSSKQMSAMERTSLSLSGMTYTPGYAPVEQEGQRLKSIGPWTDFYAVGASLYNMLTAQSPPEVDPDDIAEDSRMFDYPSGVSIQMRRAISRMMNPSRKCRPQNVEEMETLLAFRVCNPVGEETVSASQRTKPWTQTDDAALGDETLAPEERMVEQEKEVTSIQKDSHCQVPLKSNDGFENRVITVNGVSFKMIAIKGGTFIMGATPEQGEDASPDEMPAHKVSLDAFMLGETVVTQALWKAVLGKNPSIFKDDNLPVEVVSWDDCQIFIHRLNKKTGLLFRLPTEAEWEFAARGGNMSHRTKFAGGDDINNVAWFGMNFEDRGSTQPVAKKSPNELGLYDMSGNVWEWCQDRYDENYYSKSENSTNPCNNTMTSRRVLRGGCWDVSSNYCRVSCRGGRPPKYYDHNIGLRLALSIPLTNPSSEEENGSHGFLSLFRKLFSVVCL